MTDPVTVRRYRYGDGPAVRRLHAAAMRDAGAFTEGADDPDLDDVAASYLADGEFLVATVDGEVVGMGAFRPVSEEIAALHGGVDDPAAEIERMRVAPDHQREGIGQGIYDELERRARERGVRELVLDTMPSLTAARRFYEANGFVHEGDVDVEWEGEELTLVLYRKRLG